MAEFTGERVIPGQVEPDLLNEHLARYAFAARLATGRRVLDAGCGAGYGSAELARTAASVLGMDISAEALAFARARYGGVQFLQGSCAAVPLKDASLDLVTAFEVIEHIPEWELFLAEALRLLAPGGQLVVSTPNKLYYTESRRLTGPNPYHVHEFDFDEFRQRLGEIFPYVSLFLQNHIDGVSFHPTAGGGVQAGGGAQARGGVQKPDVVVESRAADPAEAHFFVAVCSLAPQPASSSFVYVPSAANILRERELHIARLEAELATKDEWLEQLRSEKQNLVEMFRAQTAELERSNQWAAELDAKLHAAQDRIVELQEELAHTIAGYRASIAAYEAQVRELEGEDRKKTAWALEVQAELEAKGAELVNCIRLLDAAEKTVEERTAWALQLNDNLQNLERKLNLVKTSRWMKLGRAAGLGPVLEQ